VQQTASTVYARLPKLSDLAEIFTVEFEAIFGYSRLVTDLRAQKQYEIRIGSDASAYSLLTVSSEQVVSRTTQSRLSLADGKLHRVAVSVNGNSVTAYVDGKRMLSDPDGAERPIARLGIELSTYKQTRQDDLMFTNFRIAEASRQAGIPHAGICGGRGRCTLCRVRLLGRYDLAPPNVTELRLLRGLGADGTSVRQACQIRPVADISVVPLVPAEAVESLMRRRHAASVPRERFLVFVFVDMRDSTQRAASRPPFDAMFILGRFVNAVSEAVVEAGGQPAEFRGDAVVAAFGQRTDARTACRQAFASLPLIAAKLAVLSDMLRDDLGGPLRFGIGVDGGATVSGEIGFGDHTTVTAFGGALSVAARLQDLTKELDCAALVSDAVMRLGEIDATAFPLYTAELRGFEQPVPVRIIHQVPDNAGTRLFH